VEEDDDDNSSIASSVVVPIPVPVKAIPRKGKTISAAKAKKAVASGSIADAENCAPVATVSHRSRQRGVQYI